MSDFVTSLIRTLVPVAVGSLVGWLAARNITVAAAAEAQLTAALVAVVTAGYYAAVRAAESRWPGAGWLLGSPATPTYSSGGSDTTGAVDTGADDTGDEVPPQRRPQDEEDELQ